MTVAAKNNSPTGMDKFLSFCDEWLIMPKVLYFFLNMFVYAFHGLMSIYFIKKWNFTYHWFGYASSVIAFNFFGAMVWSPLADRTGRYKTIIITTVILYTFAAMSLLNPVFTEPGQEVYRYTYVFIGLSLFNFFLSASFPLLDAQIMGMLAANPRVSKEQFGIQRMFGSFGHLAATLCSLFLYKDHGAWGQGIYQIVISVVFCLVVYFGVPDVKPVKGGHHGHHGHSKSEKEGGENVAAPKNPLVALFSNASFVFFLVFVAFSGVVRAISTNFQKPIAQAISHDLTLTAWLDAPRLVSEVFVYLTAKYMKNWMGVYWLLAFSQITGIARLWGYGLVDVTGDYGYWYLCGLELLKGFNSGLISSSAIPIASSLAPPGCESTAQGLYSGMYSGLSMALGGIVGGAILHYCYAAGDSEVVQMVNVQFMFRWVSIASLVITLALMAKFIFVDRVMGIPGFPRRRSFQK